MLVSAKQCGLNEQFRIFRGYCETIVNYFSADTEKRFSSVSHHIRVLPCSGLSRANSSSLSRGEHFKKVSSVVCTLIGIQHAV